MRRFLPIDDQTPDSLRFSGPASIFVAWIVAAVAANLYLRPLPLDVRLLQIAYDAGHFLALGLVTAGTCGAFRKWTSGRISRELLSITTASLGIGVFVLPADLSNMSERIAGPHGKLAIHALLAATVVLAALGVPVAFGLGRLLARPFVRWLGIGAAAAILTTHSLVLTTTYHGLHLFMGFAGTTLFGASLAGAAIPVVVARRLEWFTSPTKRTAALALLAAFAAFSIGRKPPSAVAIALAERESSLLPHFLLRMLHAPEPLRQAEIPVEMRPWFVDRKNLPSLAPSEPAFLPDKPLLILITIDCTRADVVMSGKHDDQLTTLGRLRRVSSTFSNARSTSSGTWASLTSVFIGTHYSQQYWSWYEIGIAPHADESPRLPELLGRANITSVTFTGAVGLKPTAGLVRGFSESTHLQKDHQYASAEVLMGAALERIQKTQDQALFLYLHFLDAHAPYNRAGKSGTAFERYLAELKLVDTQIGRLTKLIQSTPLRERALVIITADHGEAFGEHNTFHHSSTIYDELVRVPLLIWRPGQTGQTTDEPVSLIDLTPTILDLFRVPIPSYFMGQSLVPFLRGEKPTLHRPIISEARLKQSLVLPDGHKVIVDNRMNTVELYDLRTDPGETNSLADDEERLSRPLSLLRQFFQVQTLKRPGYTPPYRVW